MKKRLFIGKGCFVALIVLFSAFMLTVSAERVGAVEGGLGHYPHGVEDFMVGALPPPGSYYINYFLFYNITDYEDLRAPNGTSLKDVPAHGKPSVKGYALVNAMRYVFVAKNKIFGGDPFLHVIQPVAYIHKEAKSNVGDLVTDTKKGLMDTSVAAGIGWHFSKKFHLVGGLEIFMPTGAYDVDDAANPGNNYWTFMPVAALSYLSDSGFEASAKLMYNINTTNTHTGYRSGQEFHADYTLGYHFMKNWAAGVNGYYYYQTTNDSIRNEAVNFDGNKGRNFAIGPALHYNYKNMFFKLKYQWETATKNMVEGQRAWFTFIYAF
ncbi:MAG TPA: transporter [Syntrophorhabdaceae bacterium]|jgi:hypothetical protein|nr:transporter [Syntrophorhabdaceae bacterium]OQC48789.1 MAG: hypothetical protein BWX58_01008 [Deltaproteobacteria bacterium ADurb.Bin026]MBV6506944.1 hypothetical protein [Syntrophorhabdaceae bacterium]HOE19225.1 transporter [Syntrophorhabdaceae bacterium]HOF57660.1 transporter [Syntrophorhabdaceae bacterium]